MPQGNRDTKTRAWTQDAILALTDAQIRRLIRKAIAGTGIGGGGGDHGILTGLADDDHTQYLLDSPAAGASGITVGGRSISIDLAPNAGLTLGGGQLSVLLDATEPGLQKTSGLKVLTAPSGGLELAGGVKIKGAPLVSSDPAAVSGDFWYNTTDRLFRHKQTSVTLGGTGVLGVHGSITDVGGPATPVILGTAMPTQANFFNNVDRVIEFVIRGSLRAGASSRNYQFYVLFQDGGVHAGANTMWASGLLFASTLAQPFTITGQIRVKATGSSGTVSGGARVMHFKTNAEIATSGSTYDWTKLSQGVTLYGLWNTGSNNAAIIQSATFKVIN